MSEFVDQIMGFAKVQLQTPIDDGNGGTVPIETDIDMPNSRAALESGGVVVFLPFKEPHIFVPHPDSMPDDRKAALLAHSPLVNAIKEQLAKEEAKAEQQTEAMKEQAGKMIEAYEASQR